MNNITRKGFLNFLVTVNMSKDQRLMIMDDESDKDMHNLYERIRNTVKQFAVEGFKLNNKIRDHYFKNNIHLLTVEVSYMGQLYKFVFDEHKIMIMRDGPGEQTDFEDFMVSGLKIRDTHKMVY